MGTDRGRSPGGDGRALLVLRPGALGDTLLAVPALRALRRRGYGPLTLAGHAGAARLLAASGEVDRGLSFDDPALGWLLTRDQQREEGAVIAWIRSDPSLPGLQNALHVAPSRPVGESLHCAQYLVDTLAPLGVDNELDERPLKLPPIPSDEVLVHPGSGARAKNWPAAHFAAVIRTLGQPVGLIVGEADAQAAAEVEACLGRPLPCYEHPTLEHLAARLAGCRGYLGNDSGVSHLAGLSGAKAIVLFGPTSPTVWRPLGAGVRVQPFDTPPERIAALLRHHP